MGFSGSKAEGQYTPIPAGTTVKVGFKVNAGHFGEGDQEWLTSSKSSPVIMLSGEFIILEGKYKKRKVFVNFGVDYEEKNIPDGTEKWINGCHATLRAIIEAVKGISSKDVTPEAMRERDVDWAFFNGTEFFCRLGISQDKTQNTVQTIITPDMPEHAKCVSGEYLNQQGGNTGSSTGKEEKPPWLSAKDDKTRVKKEEEPPPPMPPGESASPNSPVPEWAK